METRKQWKHPLVINDCKFLESVLPMKLDHLKAIEYHVLYSDCPHLPHLNEFIFDGRTALGTTPLILACQHGEFDSVKRIVESWGVDVCAPATFYSNPFQRHLSSIEIENATPLFVAALNGYDKIVRYLLGKGAIVSVKTSNGNGVAEFDGLTPLYGAVSDYIQLCDPQRPLLQQQEERNAVVRSLLEFGANPNTDSFNPSNGKPMWMEEMCGIGAITALINHGLNLKWRYSLSGVTILHYMAARSRKLTEEDSLAIVKLLVEKGADLLARDNRGYTPLLRAADDKYDDGRLNLSVFEFLLEREEYGIMEKIEAMELAGATILFRAENAPYFPKAFDYWRCAHQIRHQTDDGSSSKKIVGRKIGRNIEWTTLAEMEELMLHPEKYTIQALLVKLRILSGFNGYRHRSLSWRYINVLTKSTSLNGAEKFIQMLHIMWGVFDVTLNRLDSFSNGDDSWQKILEDVCKVVSILKSLKENHPALLNFEMIKTSLDLILLAMGPSPIKVNNGEHTELYQDNFSLYTGTLFSQRLLCLLGLNLNLPEMSNVHNTISLTLSLRQLGPCQLGNLLLQSCKHLNNCKSLALVRVLLESGADPNVAVDELHENASLHVAAGLSDRKLSYTAGRLLVEFGAKLHQVNNAGKTAVDIWIELNEKGGKWNEEAGGWSARPEWCLPVRTLLCLAARAVRVHKIPYTDGKTPAILHPLIDLRHLQ